MRRRISQKLPPHGRTAFKKLKCYIGIPKEFEKIKAEKIKQAEKHPVEFITIGELSTELGAKFQW